MLKELFIKNIATIDELRLNFSSGFQVFTGETGAGKSILVEAIGLILGDKASQTLIRDGASEAVVEAIFNIQKFPEVKQILAKEALNNSDDEDELIIKRQITLDGKNKILVNLQRASLSLIQSLSSKLIDFTGQHQQMELLDTDNDIIILDSFLPEKTVLNDYQNLYQQTKVAQQEFFRLEKLESEKEERLSWLDFQLKAFEKVAVTSPEEEVTLKQTRERLKNATAIGEIGQKSAELLTDGDVNLVGALKQLKNVIEKKGELSVLFEKQIQALNQVQIQIEDIAYEIAKTCNADEVDAELSLDQIEEKLYLIGQLKRKFGPELSDVLAKKQELEEEQKLLQNSDQNLERLKKEFQKQFEQLKGMAAQVSEVRKKAKSQIEKAILKELQYLRMAEVKFIVEIDRVSDANNFSQYTSSGFDDVHFLLSPNPGLSPRPLAKIASGGETSRIFLALKQILTQNRKSGTLIFDEIDTGVSGAAVELVGKKLKTLAEKFQVFCVTHHAQIASLADEHLLVRKDIANQKTFTRVDILDKKSRIQEVARLMGGVEISKKNLDFAKEMIEKSA